MLPTTDCQELTDGTRFFRMPLARLTPQNLGGGICAPHVGDGATEYYILVMSIGFAPARRFAGIVVASAMLVGLSAGGADAQIRSSVQAPMSLSGPQRPAFPTPRTILPRRPTLQQKLQAETLSRSRGIDYGTARNWQRRDDARIQHQQDLNADRAARVRSQRSLDIPRMERNCQGTLFGNKYMPRSCQ